MNIDILRAIVDQSTMLQNEAIAKPISLTFDSLSHLLSSDVDFLSPLIFDWEAYKLKYSSKITDQSESGVKKDWIAKLDSLKYPDCRHGRKHDHPPGGFSLKLYYDMNRGDLALGATPTCKAIAQQFLSQGIFAATPWASCEYLH